MNTLFLLMAQYNARTIIPIEYVVRDFYSHLTIPAFKRKIALGEITLPIVRVEPQSQKGALGVHLADLAQFLDARRAAAQKEAAQFSGH